MEEVSCVVCGADDADRLYVGQDRLHGIEGVFQLVRCRCCGLVYLRPRPSKKEIGRYYPDDYRAYTGDHDLGALARLTRRLGTEKKCKAVTGMRGKGEILDVGCATGQFLSMMRDKGWVTRGIEVSQYAALYAKEKLQLEVFPGELHEAGFPEKQFDVVTMWHVLEHLHDPVATLVQVHRVLKDDGLLMVSVPNIECLQARIFGQFWAGLDVPRHLYVFSPQTLERLFERAGFRLIRTRSFFGSYDAFTLSLRFVIDERLGDSRAKGVLDRVIDNPLLRLLLTPYFSFMETAGKAPILTAYGAKHQDGGLQGAASQSLNSDAPFM